MSGLRKIAAVIAVGAVAAAVAVPGAIAKDGNRVRVAGTCTNAASAKLKLGAEDGRIEVEFEVDQNRNGVRWQVTLRRNGSLVSSTSATTRAPSGSFTVRRVIADTPGSADRVTAVAVRPGGASCTAVATF
jgi:hypothetical protein